MTLPEGDDWKSSRLQLTEFVDGNGRQLTYEELDVLLRKIKNQPSEPVVESV